MELNNNTSLDLNDPIFKGKPGWGGKLKIYFLQRFYSRALPIIIALIIAASFFVSSYNRTQAPTLSEDNFTKTIDTTVQPRQGLTHITREALNKYLEKNPQDLLPEQKIFIESYLVSQSKIRSIKPGETISFRSEDISQAIEKAKSLNQYQLEAWEKYVR